MMYVLENSNDVTWLGDCIMQHLAFTLSSVVKWKVIFCFAFGYCILHLGMFLSVALLFGLILFYYLSLLYHSCRYV